MSLSELHRPIGEIMTEITQSIFTQSSARITSSSFCYHNCNILYIKYANNNVNNRIRSTESALWWRSMLVLNQPTAPTDNAEKKCLMDWTPIGLCPLSFFQGALKGALLECIGIAGSHWINEYFDPGHFSQWSSSEAAAAAGQRMLGHVQFSCNYFMCSSKIRAESHSHVWIPCVFSSLRSLNCSEHNPGKRRFQKQQRKYRKKKKQEAKHAGMTHTWPYQTENVCWKPPSYPTSQDTLAQVEDTATWMLVGAWGLVPEGRVVREVLEKGTLVTAEPRCDTLHSF